MNNKYNSMTYYAEVYMMRFTKTKSLSKLEKLLNENKNGVFKYVVSAYLFFKDLEVNKFMHPTLYSEKQNFSKSTNNLNDGVKNKYVDAYNAVLDMYNQKQRNKDFKRKVQEEINTLLREKNLSLNFLAKKTTTHYSNLYNFLNNDLNKLSREKAVSLLVELRGM